MMGGTDLSFCRKEGLCVGGDEPHVPHKDVCVCARERERERERERFQEGKRTEVAILSLAAPLNQSESCRELVEPHHRIDVNRHVRLVVGLCVYVY